MNKQKITVQLVWGGALVLAGIGVFYRIPQVIPKIEKLEQFSSTLPFVYFCFYLLAVLLIGGGIKKIYQNFKKLKS